MVLNHVNNFVTIYWRPIRQSAEVEDLNIRRQCNISASTSGTNFNLKWETYRNDSEKKMCEESENIAYDIIKCTNFAAVKHRNQRRKDPDETPYINHPVGVAYILTEEAKVFKPCVIQAALLHDTVEDTATTFEELEENFGKHITSIVREVTDDKSLPKEKRKELQIIHAKDCSEDAKLVKLADKLYNLRDLDRVTPRDWSKERAEEYFHWAYKVVDGLRGTNKKMEEELDKLFKKHHVIQ